MPERIQRKRTRGWRMPVGAMSGLSEIERRHWLVDRYERELLERGGTGEDRFIRLPQLREALRGKDLVCWCPLDLPCHADVLLRIANSIEVPS